MEGARGGGDEGGAMVTAAGIATVEWAGMDEDDGGFLGGCLLFVDLFCLQ